jgi:hypothetical protein
MSGHVDEIKVRLTEKDAELLRVLAWRKDVPVAVLARSLIVAELSRMGSSVDASQPIGRPYEARK